MAMHYNTFFRFAEGISQLALYSIHTITSFLVDPDYMFLIIYQRVIVAASYHPPFEMAPPASSGRTAEFLPCTEIKRLKDIANPL